MDEASRHHRTSVYIVDDEFRKSNDGTPTPHRRNSISEGIAGANMFLVDIHKTKERILRHEDTDGDERVTIDDKGPKHVELCSVAGVVKRSISGNYMVSTLLQELALLEIEQSESGAHGPAPLAEPPKRTIITESQLRENPVDRLNRMIKVHFWPALVRRIDADGVTLICLDPKNRGANKRPRIYIPHDDHFALDYFQYVAQSRSYLDLEVVRLPKQITPEYVKSINTLPGILALDLERHQSVDGSVEKIVGKPFIVPGGRFNEMYGWDSYFVILGLLADPDVSNLHIAKSIIDNLVYEISHYGKILNANRSYYLLRSQPPFLTDMAMRVYRSISELNLRGDNTKAILGEEDAQEWLRRVMIAAIKEYENVWMNEPRFVSSTELSRYYPEGKGIPPETEATHFDSFLRPLAQRHHVDISTFIALYNDGQIDEPDLDGYLAHDRAVRESGHDTTRRLDNRAANLCTVDLCALLYKYEMDIATYIDEHANGHLQINTEIHTGNQWRRKADKRKCLADRFLWSEEKGMYFDYDFVMGERISYESATAFWPLWSGMASTQQAESLVKMILPKLEVAGGLVSGTKESLGRVTLDSPNRQWDYPYGWAPHQMMAWEGLQSYGYEIDARRLAYRWLFMITRSFTDFNGVVPEKFNVVQMSHKVSAEYGNVGTEFKKVPREGFGWMNASYLVGQQYLTRLEKRALRALVPPHTLFPIL